MRALFFSLAFLAVSACHAGGPIGSPAANSEPAPISSKPISQTGEICGGFGALPCAEGQFCRLEPGACLTIADASGICTEIRTICTRDYRPVCGCDGKTYPNACSAEAKGVSIGAEGPCKA